MNVNDACRYAITLTEIIAEFQSSSKKIEPGSILKIQKLDNDGTVSFFEEMEYDRKFFNAPHIYRVPDISGLLFFKPDVWRFAVAMKNFEQRIEFCKSTERRRFLSQLKVQDPVKIPYGSFAVNDGTFRQAYVKFIGALSELGPGQHFILSVMRQDFTLVPPLDKKITMPYSDQLDDQTIILSGEYIFQNDAIICPDDVELFHIYHGKFYAGNSSNHLEATSNESTIKTENPSSTSGTDTVDTQIVENNSPHVERSESSHSLDQFNQDSRNENRDVSSQNGTSHCRLRTRSRQPLFYESKFENFEESEEHPEEFNKIPGSTLGIHAPVSVQIGKCQPLNGVIRAIFEIESVTVVGVELNEVVSFASLHLTDGSFNGHRFFKCQNGKGLFIEAEYCHKDSTFSDDFVENKVFGHPESPVVTEKIPPLSFKNLHALEEIIGESKGIQGHKKSSYLDATLFSMFTFTQCFDSLLYRSVDPKDIKHYEVRAILRDEIVHPLRKHHFVRADRVLRFREKLEGAGTNEEIDPEVLLNVLMTQTLNAEPYLKFNSGQDGFYYQLLVQQNENLKLPNVQQLFEQSFKTSNKKLREVPHFMMIQMPRQGKNVKLPIVPSQMLDITDVVEGQSESCNRQPVPRIRMDLFAVICIETSHYVSYVKAGKSRDAPWLFFDSMSERRGGQHGYNIPSIVSVPDLPEWLSDEEARKMLKSKDEILPPLAKRLLCDAYMCMYVSRDASMYK